jgi:hypothetical protein
MSSYVMERPPLIPVPSLISVHYAVDGMVAAGVIGRLRVRLQSFS